jgi:hypothetical protein
MIPVGGYQCRKLDAYSAPMRNPMKADDSGDDVLSPAFTGSYCSQTAS